MNDELNIDLGLEIKRDNDGFSKCFVHILGFSNEREFTKHMSFHIYGIYKTREKAIETIISQEVVAVRMEDVFPFAIIESYAEEIHPTGYEVTVFKWNHECNKYVEIDFLEDISGNLTTSICLE